MGSARWIDLRTELLKALGFTALVFSASYLNDWVAIILGEPPALVIELLLTFAVALAAFVAYSLAFSRPQLIATWAPSKSNDECDTNPLVQPANKSHLYVVKLRLSAQSCVGYFALVAVSKMNLLASIRLDHTEHVKIVREGPQNLGNGKKVRALQRGARADGLKCEWSSAPDSWALRATFLVALNPSGAAVGNTRVNYELRVDRGDRGKPFRALALLLDRLVARDATVTLIRTQSYTDALP